MANVPPSPSSSAHKTIKTYLMVTISVIDQMIRDNEPRRSSREGGEENVEEYTYKGLVPMSPYILMQPMSAVSCCKYDIDQVQLTTPVD